jgi:hypothetical protein
MASGVMTIFGGFDHRGRAREDVWRLGSMDRWTLVEALPDAVTGRMPGPRAGAVLQSESRFGSGAAIQFFGGETDAGLADAQLWRLDETRWIEQTLAVGQAPPTPRVGTMFYFPACGGSQLGYFGGSAASGYRQDTAFLDCASGDRTCAWSDPVGLMTRPPARAYGTVGRLAGESEIILFGGEGPTGVLGDVWSLFTCGGGAQPWRLGSVTGPVPRARMGHSMTLIQEPPAGALEAFLVFGGSSSPGGNTPLADVTRLVYLATGTFRWESVTVATGADSEVITERVHHVATHDPRESRLLVYGGERRGQTLADLWELRLRP